MAETLKHYAHMLPKLEMVKSLNYAILAFVVLSISLFQLQKNFDFNICIINVKLFVLTYLECNYATRWILVVYAFYNLSECSSIYYAAGFIPVCYLFTLEDYVVSFFVCNTILITPSNFANCENSFKHTHFYLFKLSQCRIFFNCFTWT